MERAKFLVEKAFEEDEQDNEEEAVELYTQAVQFCLTLVGPPSSSPQRCTEHPPRNSSQSDTIAIIVTIRPVKTAVNKMYLYSTHLCVYIPYST